MKILSKNKCVNKLGKNIYPIFFKSSLNKNNYYFNCKVKCNKISNNYYKLSEKNLNNVRFYSTGKTEVGLPLSIKEITSLPVNNGFPVIIYGWIQSIRALKHVTFLRVSDGTCAKTIQIVTDKKLNFISEKDGKKVEIEINYSDLKNYLSTGSSIKITGVWKIPENQTNKPEKNQKEEVDVSVIELIGNCDSNYPLQKKYHSIEYLRNSFPQLRWRTSQMLALARFKSNILNYTSLYFHNQNYIQVQPPLITSSDCEGAGEVFSILPSEYTKNLQGVENEQKYKLFFGKEAFLTVSTQLHLETLVHAHPRVWTLTPAFRAEKSDTARHLAEFWMVEVEVGFVDDLDTIMNIAEDYLKYLMKRIIPNSNNNEAIGTDLLSARANVSSNPDWLRVDELKKRWDLLNPSKIWPRMTYEEAVTELKNAPKNSFFKKAPELGSSLLTEHEKYLARNGPIFITNYPTNTKPFYMKATKNRDTVECFDLLLPYIGELCGGSMREDNETLLKSAIEKNNINKETLSWYIQQRSYGSIPHGGFGIGFERLIMYLTGALTVKEVSLVPRAYNVCKM